MFIKLVSLHKCKVYCILHDFTFKKDYMYKGPLLSISKVIVPSQFIKKEYEKALVLPHPDMYNVVVKSRYMTNKKILAIGYNKGLEEIKSFIQHHKLHYLGHIETEHPNLIKYGEYDDKDIINKIKEINPYFIWFPSRFPETYCYALSYAMLSGYPIVAYDIGANSERLCNWP